MGAVEGNAGMNAAAGNAAGGAGGAAGGADTSASMNDMKATFAEAVKQNAEITKIQTQGNTAKRAASAAPQ